MSENSRFDLLYVKLRELLDQEGATIEAANLESLEDTAELDEIEDLRQIVLEVSAPPPISYTTT